MLLTIAGFILVLWLIGLLIHIGGAFIHLLLIVAAIVVVMHFLRGRKAV